MTAEMSPGSDTQRLTAASLQQVKFAPARGRGRGYDETEVDAFVVRCAYEVEMLTRRIRALEDENRRFQEHSNGRSHDDVLRSVSVLVQAQRTADTTVAQADEYSARVMGEARTLYESARRRAIEMVDEAHDKASQAAAERGAVDREATYLRTLRDVTRTQIETFLEGLLDHLAAEFGRATSEAANAAGSSDRPTRPAGPAGHSSITVSRPPETPGR